MTPRAVLLVVILLALSQVAFSCGCFGSRESEEKSSGLECNVGNDKLFEFAMCDNLIQQLPLMITDIPISDIRRICLDRLQELLIETSVNEKLKIVSNSTLIVFNSKGTMYDSQIIKKNHTMIKTKLTSSSNKDNLQYVQIRYTFMRDELLMIIFRPYLIKLFQEIESKDNIYLAIFNLQKTEIPLIVFAELYYNFVVKTDKTSPHYDDYFEFDCIITPFQNRTMDMMKMAYSIPWYKFEQIIIVDAFGNKSWNDEWIWKYVKSDNQQIIQQQRSLMLHQNSMSIEHKIIPIQPWQFCVSHKLDSINDVFFDVFIDFLHIFLNGVKITQSFGFISGEWIELKLNHPDHIFDFVEDTSSSSLFQPPQSPQSPASPSRFKSKTLYCSFDDHHDAVSKQKSNKDQLTSNPLALCSMSSTKSIEVESITTDYLDDEELVAS